MRSILQNNNRTVVYEGASDWLKSWSFEAAVNLSQFPLMHGVTRRFGGVSKGCFSSFNLGLHVEDEIEDVWENRKRLAKHLGVTPDVLTCGQQVHGLGVTEVTKADIGKGAFAFDAAIPNSDAIFTRLKEVPLLLMVADCVPVLLYDAAHEAVALAHAGWRGTIGHISVLTLEAMHSAYGTEPEHCYAYLGPSIGPKSFEVEESLADTFRMAKAGLKRLVTYHRRPGASVMTPHIDLKGFIADDLLNWGVPSSHITVSATDSMTNAGCYSHRRDHGHTGRMAMFAKLIKRR